MNKRGECLICDCKVFRVLPNSRKDPCPENQNFPKCTCGHGEVNHKTVVKKVKA